MFISPRIAIENRWIVHPQCLTVEDWEQKKLLGSNAIDFTLDKVYTLNTDETPSVSENFKKMRSLYELPSLEVTVGQRWELEGGRVYDGMSHMYVEVPENVAAVLYTRSSFTRNGVFITSGLYDSGFKGSVGFTIFTVGGAINIDVGTRIGQIAFVEASAAKMYAGGWNHEQGTHYADQKETPEQAPADQPAVTQLERPIGSNPDKSEFATDLEESHKSNSNQGSKRAGTKNFL